MSKHAIGIAVLALAALLSGAAIGKGGGWRMVVAMAAGMAAVTGGGHHGGGHGHGHAHFGGGHHGGGGFARSHASRGGFASHHAIARHGGQNFGQMRNAQLGSRNVRNALNSLSRSGGLRNGRLLAIPRRGRRSLQPRRWRDGMAARRRLVAARGRRIWLGRPAVLAVRL